MTILITIILTVLVCLGFLAWVLESSNMDYPILSLNLREMEGFTTNGIKWDTVNDDLKPLLHHSDCDGYLSSTDCKKIANRLNTIVEALEQTKEYPSEDYNWHIAKAKQFAKGCMSAYDEKEQLKFH